MCMLTVNMQLHAMIVSSFESTLRPSPIQLAYYYVTMMKAAKFSLNGIDGHRV